MQIPRDFLRSLQRLETLEVILLTGPRQVGKTTLLLEYLPKTEILLDDLLTRKRAQEDPALALEGAEPPVLIDEVQYAPNLFSEIKLRVDRNRRVGIRDLQYLLTGSNKILLDRNMKESLAGRCNSLELLGLSVAEIITHISEVSLKSILFRGGFPELYVRPNLPITTYLNDYISSFVQKDIAVTSGVEKMGEFQSVLLLLAARTGQFFKFDEVSNASGVDQKTVSRWVSLLEHNKIVKLLRPYSSNLSKRIVKMPKLYFYETGLCARLQGHNTEDTLWNSPQAGALFETLVFSELEKTRLNFFKSWELFTWRTKEKAEIDFILQQENKTLFIESKLGIHSAKPFEIGTEAKKVFAEFECMRIVVTVGGQRQKLSQEVEQVPIKLLSNYLLEWS